MTDSKPPSPTAVEASTQPRNVADQIILRCLIASRDAGVVIGKGGQNVQDIREVTGARVKVSEHVPGIQERILSIQGSPESIASALEMVMLKLVASNESEPQNTRFPSNRSNLTFRILIPHVLMGAIIGKSGVNIRTIQNNSGSRIVASEQLLSNSTDRCVSLTGEPPQIQKAILDIAIILREALTQDDHKLQGHVAYRPSMKNSRFGDDSRRGPDNRREPGTQIRRPNNPEIQEGPQVTQEIHIPNNFVGAIIGKGGMRIRDIRDRSGSQIRIAEPDGSNERLLSVTGTEPSIQAALVMIYARLEQEKTRLSGNTSETSPVASNA